MKQNHSANEDGIDIKELDMGFNSQIFPQDINGFWDMPGISDDGDMLSYDLVYDGESFYHFTTNSVAQLPEERGIRLLGRGQIEADVKIPEEAIRDAVHPDYEEHADDIVEATKTEFEGIESELGDAVAGWALYETSLSKSHLEISLTDDPTPGFVKENIVKNTPLAADEAEYIVDGMRHTGVFSSYEFWNLTVE